MGAHALAEGDVAGDPEHSNGLDEPTKYQTLLPTEAFNRESENSRDRDDFDDAVDPSGEEAGVLAFDAKLCEDLSTNISTMESKIRRGNLLLENSS
jgi:hypothetical protein